MIKKIGIARVSEFFSFKRPSMRYATIIVIIAFSILSYALTISADEDSSLTSVTVLDGDKVFEVEMKGRTVGDALLLANITLGENDTLSKDIDAELKDDDVVTVKRAKRFYLVTSGKTFEVNTNETTVGDALLADGFQVGKYDEVVPDVTSQLVDGMTVSVTRVFVEIFDVEEEIPFSERVIENPEKEVGYESFIQVGKPGVTVRTFKKVMNEALGVTASLIGETVVSEPVEQIVEIGTKVVTHLTPGKTTDGVPYAAIPTMAQNNSKTYVRGNTAVTPYGTFTFSKKISCKATAYEGSSASNGKWAGMTATGRDPEFGIVAVDPRVIPLNSKIYVESADGGKSWIYGFAVAGDTGGAIKGNRIDLFYNTLSQCYQFGRRNAVVYILD